MFCTLGFPRAFALPGKSVANTGAEQFRCVGPDNSPGSKVAQRGLKSYIQAAKPGSFGLR